MSHQAPPRAASTHWQSVDSPVPRNAWPHNVESHNVEPMPRKKFIAKGHDAQLQEAQIDRIPVELTTLSGVVVSGTVSRRDKYTISLRHGEGENVGRDEIFYKHAIESVLLVRATPRAN